MKWFDSLFRKKHTPAKLTKDWDVSMNQSHKSHKDIDKRPLIDLAQGVFSSHKNHTNHLTLLDDIFLKVRNFFLHLTIGRSLFIVFLISLAFIVYSLGFLIRTERNIQSLKDDPGQIVTTEGYHRVRQLFQDYQILGIVARNPLFPLEPLATYGHLLDHVRDIVGVLHALIEQEQALYSWHTNSHTESILPLLRDVFDDMRTLSAALSAIETLLGDDVAPLATLTRFIQALIDHEQEWYTLLGKDGPTRILLLNQNSDELRAGGGFPGTAFLVEFDNGRMIRFEFYDIYALDWQLKGYRPSPEGINQFRSREYPGKPAEFEIRDANYYPLFSESAKKIDEFTQAAGIGHVDLVVGINQKFLEDIIALVEPLDVPGIEVPLDHYNAMLVVSMLVEGKKSTTPDEKPKGTVKKLGDVLFRTLQSENKLNQALFILAEHVLGGEVILGSSNPALQKALDDMGIFDRWREEKSGWVYPLFTSISRNKSDRLMERNFEIKHIDACERELTLSQKHWFDLTERNRIQDLARKLDMEDKIPLLLPVQGGADNIQYLRFILPPGTKLSATSQFSLLEHHTLYTSIHGYETTKPGTTTVTKIRYTLPEKYCGERTEFFKQPGLRNTRVVIRGKEGNVLYQKFYE